MQTVPILMVSDATDDSLRETVAELRAAGAEVCLVPDVYAAMARVAHGDPYDWVLVDVRTIDRAESEFLNLAPRYFDGLRIEVPWLDGTSRAVVQLGQPALRTTEVAAIVDSVRMAASVPAVVSAETNVQSGEELSTSTGLESEGAGAPSLHEAVRLRMAEDAAAPVRRTPPSRTPPAPSAPPTSNNLTDEEVEALFDATDLDDGNGGSAP